MEDHKIKEEMMRVAMEEFDSKVAEDGGMVNGIKYTRDNQLEIQIRVDYLTEEFGAEATENEISKYRNAEGTFMDDLVTVENWNTVLSNLKSKNI